MPEPRRSLEDQVEALPEKPGVYQFLGSHGAVLYVGKARRLRTRARQYLRGSDERPMVPFLIEASRSIRTTIVQTDKEACILESTLIKKHRPRFNIRLTDDSNFLHIRLNPEEDWPRYTLVRKLERDSSHYFGPFASASRARSTLEFIERRFPLRSCTDRELKSRKRPCLLHQMARCLAPCVDLCTPDEYQQAMQESILFLEGRNRELLDQLQTRMKVAADKEAYEEAARIRDLIRSIQATLERQHVVDASQKNRDVWALHREGAQASITLLPVRKGRVQEAINLAVDGHPGTDEELLSTTLNLWYLSPGEYEESTDRPHELLLTVLPEDCHAIEELLSERSRRKTSLRVPRRGKDRRLLELASTNAKADFNRRISGEEQRLSALRRLQHMAHLTRMPTRIECFDNSNIQGTDPVAAMAVFTNGKPDRKRYRRYRVKTVVGSDDFASMAEILERRLRRGIDEVDLPELIVVDGGKGQLSAARAVLRELGIRDQARPGGEGPLVDIIGISKPRTEHAAGNLEATDRLVLPDIRDPITLRAGDPALRMVQTIRDAAHQTAIQFHRKRRRKTRLGSQLDQLPGVGPTRKKALLRHFGSVAAIRSASVADLCAVPGLGHKLATQLYQALHSR
jgi:excinuclease ABC subunit C